MTGFLLDTNILSELTRAEPDSGVLAFLDDESDDVWLPSVAVYEAEYGLRLLPVGRRRDLLVASYASILATYSQRVLPFDRAAAEWAANLRAHARRVGRHVDLGDVLIAGTARANDLAVATRNVKDFEPLDVDVLNPWDSS
ncbi:MAG: type II toxin-antitoxin system VapC family toxin [Dehalococcoidia bacterium]|nr:type II toxin-antitoxin system VapC family toxin [Dehalococcoidia bacterium]MYA53479.1 type II toxin-antitoxin system VapC family toxin [Dehalococcoidia bacterium]